MSNIKLKTSFLHFSRAEYDGIFSVTTFSKDLSLDQYLNLDIYDAIEDKRKPATPKLFPYANGQKSFDNGLPKSNEGLSRVRPRFTMYRKPEDLAPVVLDMFEPEDFDTKYEVNQMFGETVLDDFVSSRDDMYEKIYNYLKEHGKKFLSENEESKITCYIGSYLFSEEEVMPLLKQHGDLYYIGLSEVNKFSEQDLRFFPALEVKGSQDLQKFDGKLVSSCRISAVSHPPTERNENRHDIEISFLKMPGEDRFFYCYMIEVPPSNFSKDPAFLDIIGVGTKRIGFTSARELSDLIYKSLPEEPGYRINKSFDAPLVQASFVSRPPSRSVLINDMRKFDDTVKAMGDYIKKIDPDAKKGGLKSEIEERLSDMALKQEITGLEKPMIKAGPTTRENLLFDTVEYVPFEKGVCYRFHEAGGVLLSKNNTPLPVPVGRLRGLKTLYFEILDFSDMDKELLLGD